MSRPLRVLVARLTVVTVVASVGAVAAAPGPAHAAVECGSVGYSYDAAGRLVGVSNVDGAAAAYDYDPVGNTTAVRELGAAPLTVHSLTPTRGPAGTAVTISGGCFASTAGGNEVRFDGVSATVTSASAYRRRHPGDRPVRPGHHVRLRRSGQRHRSDRTGRDTAGADHHDDVRHAVRPPVSVSDPLGHLTRYGYDAAGNRVSVTDADGRVWRAGYTMTGQLVSATDPLGHTTTYQYDRGDLIAVTDPLGRTTRSIVDAAGRVVGTVDPAGATTRTGYDVDDNVASVLDPLGNTTSFSHDGNGNLTRVVDARGNARSFAYDPRDRLAEATDPLGAVTRYGYDRLDQPTSTVDRRGVTSTWSYDVLGRLGQARHGAESPVTYGYDGLDRLVALEDMTWEYDAHDRMVSETGPTGTVGHQYDAADRVTGMTVAGQPPIAYAYDSSDLLTSVSQAGVIVTWTRDTAARLTRMGRPGLVTTYTYDDADQLTALSYTTGSGYPVGDLRYAYDPTGRVAELAGSLARVTIPATGPTVSYDAADRLTTRGGQTFAYDAAGNLTSDGTRTYTWNARGELSTVNGDNLDVSFGYDATGRRHRVTVNGSERRYVYDGPNLVREAVDGVAADRLTAGLDETLLRINPVGTRTPLTDHLGTVLGLADPGGSLVSRYLYDPYGEVSAGGEQSGNTQQYTGREYDAATGLLYNRARYYSPSLGRFISEDPVGLAGGTTNLYRYANSDPTNLSDPSGLFPWSLVGGCAAGIGFGILLNGRKYTVPDAARDCVIGALGGWLSGKLLGGLRGLSRPPFRYANRHPTFRPGPYAKGSIPARNPSPRFENFERRAIDQLGYRHGCHTCGVRTPGTKGGHYVPDHQPPTSINVDNLPQRLYPHCLPCSREQGLAAAALRRALGLR